MNQPPRQQPPLIGVEAAVLAVGLVAVGIAVATCAGARLAALVAGGECVWRTYRLARGGHQAGPRP
jgi:hypothetical protein